MKKYKLFTDGEVWHREYPISASLRDMSGVYGRRIRLVAYYGNSKEYRVDGTGYRFCVRIVD